MADVVYLIQDMLFTSKVREVAKTIGVSVQGARDPAALAAAAARGAKLVIVDLRLPIALEALARWRPIRRRAAYRRSASSITRRPTSWTSARAKGCGDVMAKGQFANALPKLLAGLVPT